MKLSGAEQKLVDGDEKIAKLVAKAEEAGRKDAIKRVSEAAKDVKAEHADDADKSFKKGVATAAKSIVDAMKLPF